MANPMMNGIVSAMSNAIGVAPSWAFSVVMAAPMLMNVSPSDSPNVTIRASASRASNATSVTGRPPDRASVRPPPSASTSASSRGPTSDAT
jgi:hypothetical protein